MYMEIICNVPFMGTTIEQEKKAGFTASTLR